MARSTNPLPPELRLGAIALRMGFVSKAQLEDAIAYQERRGMQEYLGSVLLMLDYLSPKTLAQVLAEQKRQIAKHAKVDSLPTSPTGQKRFGRIAVEMGLVTEAQVEEALEVQAGSSPRPFLGAVLLDRGHLTSDDITHVLAAQFAPGTAPAPAPAAPKTPPSVLKLADGPGRPVPAPAAPAAGGPAKGEGSSGAKAAPARAQAFAAGRPAAAAPAVPAPLTPADLQLGRIAVRMGYLTPEELEEALSVQKRRSPKPFLGALLVELDMISSKSLAQVLSEQVAQMAKASQVSVVPRGRAEEGRFGRIAITCGFITRDQLNEALGIQSRSTPKPFLGAVLVDLGYMSPRQLSRVLAAQASGEGFDWT